MARVYRRPFDYACSRALFRNKSLASTPRSVYYAICPGTGGTNDKKTGSPNISISSGVATLDVTQTDNIGQGFRITYDSSAHYCFISKVNSATSFDVVDKQGFPAPDHASVAVNSIAADYASMSAAEAGASDSTHLNTVGLVVATTILNLVCYAGASADTTACTIDGWTTNETYNLKIYTPIGGTQSINSQRHSGVWDDNKYNIHVSSNGSGTRCIRVASQVNLYVDGIQLKRTSNTGTLNNCFILNHNTSTSAHTVQFENSIFTFNMSGDNNSSSIIRIQDYSATPYVTFNLYNCIVYNGYGNDSNSFLVMLYSGVAYNLYNCTIGMHSTYAGITRSSGTATVKNCIVFNTTDDFTGTITVDYCASDDGDGTNHIHLNENASGEWTAAFTDYVNFDFHVKNTSSLLYNAGTDLSTVMASTDIIGTARPQGASWDIGAFEYLETLNLIQEGFRFRNDDGDEASATWNASQDTNINLLGGNNIRLRLIADTTGEANNQLFQLEYRYRPTGNNWGNWTKVT